VIPHMISAEFLESLLNTIEEHSSQPITVMVCKPTLRRLWHIHAQEERAARARKRKRRHQRAIARRRQRGLA
jgi:hypothetical protein